MTVHKYALLTKIDNENYEVFHIVRFLDEDQESIERILRISKAIEPENFISGLDATGKSNLLIGSTWDGINFTLPEIRNPKSLGTPFENGITHIHEDGSEHSTYALLSNNVVFLMIMPLKQDPVNSKFTAAFSNDILVKKIEESQIVSIGYIWDGTEFKISK